MITKNVTACLLNTLNDLNNDCRLSIYKDPADFHVHVFFLFYPEKV